MNSENSIIEYLQAIRAGDADKAIGWLSEEVKLKNVTWNMLVGRDVLIDIVHWEIGAGVNFEYAILSSDNDSIAIHLIETSKFMQLLEFPPLESRVIFEVDNRNKISQITQSIVSGGATPEAVNEAIQPIIAWARECEWKGLETLLTDGRINFSSQASAEGWLSLIQSWQNRGQACGESK